MRYDEESQKMVVSTLKRNVKAPEGFAPIRFFDKDYKLVREFYVNPDADIYLTFDCEYDEDDNELYTRLISINYRSASDLYCENMDINRIVDFDTDVVGLKLVGYNVVSTARVDTGIVATENVLCDGEKNFFPIYE